MLSARKAPDWAVSLDQGEDQGQGQAHAASRSSVRRGSQPSPWVGPGTQSIVAMQMGG